MNREIKLNIDEQVSVWAEQLRTDPSFTGSDVEELKSHLIDLSEELKLSGLNDNEAFVVAASRLGVTSLKNEFEEINLPVIQLRKTILVLSGILFFFLLYFFMISSTRLLFLVLHDLIVDPHLRIKCVVIYVIVYHLFIIAGTLFLYFFSEKMERRIEKLKIKPHRTFLLFSGIVVLAITDLCFRQLIKEVFGTRFYTSVLLTAIFDYLAYIYPLVIVICFVVLFKKYYFSAIMNGTNSVLASELPSIPENTPINSQSDPMVDQQLKSRLDLHLKELEKIPLSTEEAYGVAKMRMGIEPWGNYTTASSQGNSIRNLMIVLSGVLVYFFLHFLLFSSARILFTALQYFENDPVLNIRRTWLYVLNFQGFFVFFTAGFYFLDKNIVQRLNRLHIKPVHTFWLLFATIFLAIVDRCLFPITRNLIGRDHIDLTNKFINIFVVSDYTFPFILCACFLVLFCKYYRDHVRIGN